MFTGGTATKWFLFNNSEIAGMFGFNPADLQGEALVHGSVRTLAAQSEW